jgi:GT2 family glycosyltransferase
VPATDAPPTLARCLAALGGADEVVAVEDAGLGPAAARNEGARRARGDVVVFVDADVVAHRDAIERIRATLEADPGLAGIFGAYDDAPEQPSVVSTFRNLLHHHVHSESAGDADTFWAGLGAVRREAFEAVGGFDERYEHPSVEDVELGLRLADRGFRLCLDPSVRGTHLKAWTLGEMVRTDVLRRGAPWVALLLERRRVPTSLNLGWRHRASAVASLVGALALLRGRPRALLGAAAVLVALNGRLYALVARRRGPAAGVAAVGLHALHHLCGVVAVPLGLATYLSRSRAR